LFDFAVGGRAVREIDPLLLGAAMSFAGCAINDFDRLPARIGKGVLTEGRAGARLARGGASLTRVRFDQSTGISMPIYKSSEFKGFGFNYDQSQQPFFKALVKENLRLLNALPTGKLILSAIHKAKPARRSNYPDGVNVILQPPISRGWSTPGLGRTQARSPIRRSSTIFSRARAS